MFSGEGEKFGMALMQEEAEADRVALASQRSIELIEVKGPPKACLVIPAVADGDCGFTASRLCLIIQGREDFAQKFNRDSFIKLIKEIMQDPLMTERFAADISNILQADNSQNLMEWENKFKSSGYWLQEPHFAFLSKIFNIRFNFYYLPPEEAIFKPELSYETIFCGEDEQSSVTISLAHVSTRLKDKPDASLNHFDGIIIEPTQAQRQKIAQLSKKREEEIEASKRAAESSSLLAENNSSSSACRHESVRYRFNDIISHGDMSFASERGDLDVEVKGLAKTLGTFHLTQVSSSSSSKRLNPSSTSSSTISQEQNIPEPLSAMEVNIQQATAEKMKFKNEVHYHSPLAQKLTITWQTLSECVKETYLQNNKIKTSFDEAKEIESCYVN